MILSLNKSIGAQIPAKLGTYSSVSKLLLVVTVSFLLVVYTSAITQIPVTTLLKTNEIYLLVLH